MSTAVRRTLTAVLSTALLVTFLSAAPSTADPGEHTHKVFGANSHPYDLGYTRWLARWAKWIQELPVRDFPSPDSASNCDVHGPAVFMGPLGAAGCTIPAGKAVAIQPYLQWECSTAEGLGETYRELRKCAVQRFRRDWSREEVTLRVRVDGKRLEQPRRWTFTSQGRVVDLPKNNIWGAPPGPTKSIMRGVFYLLRPLAEGDHYVRVRLDFGQRFDIYRYRFTVASR
jgi:hypothetical protein